MAGSDFSLNGRLSLDASKFRRSVGQAEKSTKDLREEIEDTVDEIAELDKAKAEPQIETPDVEGAGAEAGGGFSAAFAKAAAPAAVAAAFVGTFNTGIDRLQLQSQMQAKFGLTKQEAERQGQLAGDIYADGWGESLEEVNLALGLVEQKLGDVATATGESTAEITTDVLAMGQTFDRENEEIIRSINQLVQNELVGSVDEATDLMITAFQNGADGAGDLTDSIDEYAQHYAALGLSAEDMMAQFIHGMENGQRDTDKLADAVKEFRIRATEDTEEVSGAFVRLGLDADATREAIAAGGPSAREAFGQVLTALSLVDDPVKQQKLAVQLLGTQYEDLGPTGLASLRQIETGLGDVNRATEDLVTTQGEYTSEVEKLWRNVSGAFGEVAEEFAGHVNTWVSAAQGGTSLDNSPLIQGLKVIEEFDGSTIQELTSALMDAGLSAEQAGAYMVEYADTIGFLRDENVDLAAKMVDASIDAALQEEQIRRNQAAAEEAAGATDGLTTSLSELQTKQRELVNPAFAAQVAQENLTTALGALNTEGGNTPENLRGVVEAQMALDAANIEVAESTGDVTGDLESLGGRAGLTEEQIDELTTSIEDVTKKAEDFAGDYEAEVRADTTAAESALTDVSRERIARIKAEYVGGSIFVPIRVGNTTGASAYMDSGGRLDRGRTAIVAEKRPEFVNGALIHTPALISGPADVTGGAATAALLGAMSSGISAGTGSGGAPSVSTGSTEVRVFIGDRELTDIVDTRIVVHDQQTAAAITAGRR